VSTDGQTWRAATLELRPLSTVSSLLLDNDQVVLAVNERATGNSREQHLRLFSTRDGIMWQSIPAPVCSADGSYGPAAAARGTWAIVVGTDTPHLAVSFDRGATWSCNELTGESFEAVPRWGPPLLTSISDLQGKLALVGGRMIEPGARGNWAAAIWYLS
jgi:hypothetical protein